MSINIEMCFCMLKKNGNVFDDFTDVISKAGWQFSKSNETGWLHGPVNFLEYYRIDNKGHREDLLVELYSHHEKYDEYQLTFRPAKIDSSDNDLEYSISKDLFDLILLELQAFDFYCGNMGLESYGFEKNMQDDRYAVGKGNVVFLSDTLLELAYISNECRDNDYNVKPSALREYKKIDLNKGSLYLRHNIVNLEQD